MLVGETSRQFRSFPVLKEKLKIGVSGREKSALRVSVRRFQASGFSCFFFFVITEILGREGATIQQCCSLHLCQSVLYEINQPVLEVARLSLKAWLLDVYLSWPNPPLLEVVSDCYCILRSNSLSSLRISEYASADEWRHRLTRYIVQGAVPLQAR